MTNGKGRKPKSKIVRTVLREEISRIIVERILDGTYPPGSRIVESQLAKEFGTSQAPAREALRDLEGMNLIESQPHKGARVREVDPTRLNQIYPVRAALEELAGREAATKIDDMTLKLLEAEMQALQDAADADDPRGQMLHDTRFHEIILETTDNQVLVDIWRSLKVESGTFVNVLRGHWDLHMIAERHKPLLEAARSRDPERLGKEMRAHIEHFAEMVRKETSRAEPKASNG